MVPHLSSVPLAAISLFPHFFGSLFAVVLGTLRDRNACSHGRQLLELE